MTQNWVFVEAFLLFAGAMGKGRCEVEESLVVRLGVCRALAIMGCLVALERLRREECPRVKMDSNIPKGERRGGVAKAVMIPPKD